MTNPRELRLSLIARAEQALAAAGRAVPDPGRVAEGERGRADAVDDLLAPHADAVYRYALRLTRDQAAAQDLMQETLLRGWRRKRSLREPAAARTWLLAIATNLHRDGLRQAAARPTLVCEEELPGDERTAAGGERITQQENVTRALAALDELPMRQRQAMHLSVIEQLEHAEAAKVLDVSVDAFKASLSEARRQMREKLKDIYDEIRGARTP